MSQEEDFDLGGLMEDPEGYYPPSPPPTKQIFTLGSGKDITLHLVGSSHTEAHLLWNGARIISEYFEEDPSRVSGKTVLELGAAAGLPSLVAAILGAKKVVMTDYHDLVANMQKNIDKCNETVEPVGHITKTVVPEGFIWGRDVDHLLAHVQPVGREEEEQGFDVLILTDLVFRHTEHGNLVKTIKETMKARAESKAYVFFTTHRPWKRHLDMKFFDVARDSGLLVEQVVTKKLDKPMFENDPGDLEVQKTVNGFVLRWPAPDGATSLA